MHTRDRQVRMGTTQRSASAQRKFCVEALEDRLLLSDASQTVPLVNDSTPGFYNAALGTVLDGTQSQYPCANVRCGDPTIRSALEPNLTAAAGVLGNWLVPDPFPLNPNWSASSQPIPSKWAVNTETAIIYPIDAGPQGLVNARGNFGVDNGIFVWVNGVFKFGALAPGGAPAFEYPNIDLGNLHPGQNFIQILREDHGGRTGFTTLITGDTPVNCSQGRNITVDRVVPGTSDPWLAGMPDGASASSVDRAPNQSPVLVPGLPLSAGGRLTFATTGAVNNVPRGGGPGPDGLSFFSHRAGAENGISNVTAPINSLVGIFLGPDHPSLSPAPVALNFSASGNVADGVNYLTLAPQVQQVFFIGDGHTSTGTVQQVIVPSGATRLFLGTMDGYEWSNNSGSFNVNLTAVCVNAAPVAADDSYSVAEDNTLTATAPGVLANDTDVDGDTLTATLTSGPAHGTLVFHADGSFQYIPAPNFWGSDSFTYTVSDGSAESNLATVSLTVICVNDAPVAVDDSYTVTANTTLIETDCLPGTVCPRIFVPHGVFVNDYDPDREPFSPGLSAVLVDGPSHGRLTFNANGRFVYTPDCDFIGTDSFTYKATDGLLDSNLATVTITVTPEIPDFSVRDGSLSITGGAGHVALLGGPGNDELAGDSVNDLLIEGAGVDWLLGSSGGDVLVAEVLDDPVAQLDLGSVLAPRRADTSPTAEQAATQSLIDHVLCDRACDSLTDGPAVDQFVAALADALPLGN